MSEKTNSWAPVSATSVADRVTYQHAQREPEYSWAQRNGQLLVAALAAVVSGLALACVVVGLVMGA